MVINNSWYCSVKRSIFGHFHLQLSFVQNQAKICDYNLILYITTSFLIWNQQFTLWKYSLLKDLLKKIYVHSLYNYELFYWELWTSQIAIFLVYSYWYSLLKVCLNLKLGFLNLSPWNVTLSNMGTCYPFSRGSMSCPGQFPYSIEIDQFTLFFWLFYNTILKMNMIWFYFWQFGHRLGQNSFPWPLGHMDSIPWPNLGSVAKK